MKSISSLIDDLVSYSWEIPRIIIVTFFLVITFRFISENKGNSIAQLRMILKDRWLTLFLFNLALILTGSLLVRQHTNPYKRIFENFGFRDDSVWNKEILENILIFIPYSFLYMQAFKPNGGVKVALFATLMTSICIEIGQLIFWLGSFQFADIVHNCIGGIIGCWLWILIEWIFKRIHKINTKSGSATGES